MTVDELIAAIPGMNDEELQAAFAEEAGRSKPRTTALEAINDAAAERGIGLSHISEDTPDEKAPISPAERAARQLEAEDRAMLAKIDADPRKALLTLFRRVEHISNHLNIRLPS